MDRSIAKRELCLYIVTFILCILLSSWACAQCENCDRRGQFDGDRQPEGITVTGALPSGSMAPAWQTQLSQTGNESSICDDGNPCTKDYRGDEGCRHDPIDCDDENSATTDFCTSSGCVHVPIGGQSPAGNDSAVQMPAAQSTPIKSQPDQSTPVQSPPLSLPSAPSATNETQACDDGNPCTDDIISGNECIHAARDCSDGNESTYDYCMDAVCVNAPKDGPLYGSNPLQEGNASIEDSDINISKSLYEDIIPADGNASAQNNTTIESESAAMISFQPRSCDDGDPCTNDTFNGERCVHTPKSCDDGNASTNDYCYNGECYHTAEHCDDGKPCTDDTYDGSKCINITKSCDDRNACTRDSCKDGECIHERKNCTDGNPCTDDICIRGHCINTWKCDDGNPCTVDYCDSKWGCIHTPVVCGDGKICIDGACRYPYYYGYYYPYAAPYSPSSPASSYTIAAGTPITLPWGQSVTASSDLRVDNAAAYSGSLPSLFIMEIRSAQAGSALQNRTISEQAQMVGLSWNEAAFSMVLIQPNSTILSTQGDNVNVVHLMGWNYDYYFLRSPSPGNWTVQVTPINAATTGTGFSLITGLVKGASP